MQNRIFGNGNGPKRATPAQVSVTLAKVRAGDPKVCIAFAREVLKRLDRGETIRPMKATR